MSAIRSRVVLVLGLSVFCIGFAALSVECVRVLGVRSNGFSSLRRRRHQLSTEFPAKEDVIEMAILSHLVYKFRGQTDCNSVSPGNPILPPDVQCHFYRHDLMEGTQVLVLSNAEKHYLAIVFAGTDDLRTTLADGDIFMKPFGSSTNNETGLLPGRVHAGFDNSVFKHGLDQTIRDIVSKEIKPDYRIFTTGHSLGAADAILVAADLVLTQNRKVTSINFGCPKIGNYEFIQAMNSLDNLHVWRFVWGWDLVPRLPAYPFEHVGHTIQMTRNETKVYYQHNGNATLNFVGVPAGWGATPFVWVPGAMSSHRMVKYLEHLQDPTTELDLHRFETMSDVPIIDDDDFHINPPDDFISSFNGNDMTQFSKEE